MSIQYAGGAIVFENAWAQSAGTKTELCNRIYADFIAAGWSSIAVTGTAPSVTAFTVRSASTPTSALQCEVKCDTASTNCVRLYMQEVSANNPQTGGLFLLPAAAKTWMMVFNKYQFFIWVRGSNSSRGFAAGGVPYLPSFLSGSLTTCIWGHASAQTDGDNTVRDCFRTLTHTCNSSANAYQNANGSWWELNNQSVNSVSAQRLVFASASYVNATTFTSRWHDYSAFSSDPLIAFGALSNSESLIRGQLWDSFISSDAWSGDTTITYDSRTYIALTHMNTGVQGNSPPGTIWIAVS